MRRVVLGEIAWALASVVRWCVGVVERVLRCQGRAW